MNTQLSEKQTTNSKNIKITENPTKQTVFCPAMYMLALRMPVTQMKCPVHVLANMSPGRELGTLHAGFVTSPRLGTSIYFKLLLPCL